MTKISVALNITGIGVDKVVVKPIEFLLFCASCDEELAEKAVGVNPGGVPFVLVNPCPKCTHA